MDWYSWLVSSACQINIGTEVLFKGIFVLARVCVLRCRLFGCFEPGCSQWVQVFYCSFLAAFNIWQPQVTCRSRKQFSYTGWCLLTWFQIRFWITGALCTNQVNTWYAWLQRRRAVKLKKFQAVNWFTPSFLCAQGTLTWLWPKINRGVPWGLFGGINFCSFIQIPTRKV